MYVNQPSTVTCVLYDIKFRQTVYYAYVLRWFTIEWSVYVDFLFQDKGRNFGLENLI